MADYTTTAASVVFSVDAEFDKNNVAAEAIAVGDIVFKNDDGHWEKAQIQANDDSELSDKHDGFGMVAAGASAAGQPCIVCTFDPALDPSFTVAIGTPIVLSGTKAKMAPATDIASNMKAVLLAWPTETSVGGGNDLVYFRPVVSAENHA